MPIYMRVMQDGVPVMNGDATAKGHEKWIELASLQVGTVPRYVSSRPSTPEIVITKSMDSASNELWRRSLYSKGLTFQFDFVKPGEQSPYLTYTLHDTQIFGFNIATHQTDETMTLTFAKMTYDTHDASPDVSRHSAVIMKGSTGNTGARRIR